MALTGIRDLRVDTNHINFFSRDHPLGQSARVIDDELSGIYSFQILLEGPPESLGTPENLQRMDRLENELRKLAERQEGPVGGRLRAAREQGAARRRSPPPTSSLSDPATVAQELFVFTLGGEGRRELERVVASDYSRAQIDVKLRADGLRLVLQLIERTDKLAADDLQRNRHHRHDDRIRPAVQHARPLPGGVADQQLRDGVRHRLRRHLRHLPIDQVRLPDDRAQPAAGAGGTRRHGLPRDLVNIATVMVASVALGVVDDDTIHFINRYRREVAAGAATDRAIELATVHEGRASLTTAVINSLAFGVLLFSEYKPTAWFGGLLGLTMAVAFLAEVFILPATIKLLPGLFGAEALRGAGRRPAAA